MTRRSITAAVLAFAVSTVQGTWVQAQWGYPAGFGGFGWGGWGGQTVQGDIATGLGAYAAGAGYYNLKTAVADSINADTVMRWNQYLYESQMNANRSHFQRLARIRENSVSTADQVRSRLRDNPDPADINRGDALNVALDEINDPRVYVRNLQGGKVKVGGESIRNIPFQKASAAITVSIHQLVNGGPPAVLLRPEFAAEMGAVKALGQELRGQIEDDKDPDPETIKKLLAAIGKAEARAGSLLPRNSRDRNEADRFLKAIHGLIAMIDTPAIDVILAGVENRPDATLGDLLAFMRAFSLRFGVASTPQQRQVYGSLFPKLVDLRKEVVLAREGAAAPSLSGNEPKDFFSGMTYEDLGKKAPPAVQGDKP
jgi:hypothetical protein